jgi:hypothetical protein
VLLVRRAHHHIQAALYVLLHGLTERLEHSHRVPSGLLLLLRPSRRRRGLLRAAGLGLLARHLHPRKDTSTSLSERTT